MENRKPNILTIAVSSRALFHIEDGNAIFEKDGAAAFEAYMRKKETVPLREGAAFPLVKKLLALNTPGKPRDRVEVLLLSRNSPDAGMRVMNSIKHYGLDIERAVFSCGSDRFRYAQALGAHLFLSVNQADVVAAVNQGLAAATMIPCETDMDHMDKVVRFAFDGDSVVFDSEADDVYRTQGLEEFHQSEINKAAIPLQGGPFKAFLQELSSLQQQYPRDASPVQIALMTARGCPAHERVLRTLRSWGIRLDEAIFAGGRPKGPLLRAYGADIFFDDTMRNVDSATSHNISSGHVPYGTGQGIVAAK